MFSVLFTIYGFGHNDGILDCRFWRKHSSAGYILFHV